jgi:hypothetical protein
LQVERRAQVVQLSEPFRRPADGAWTAQKDSRAYLSGSLVGFRFLRQHYSRKKAPNLGYADTMGGYVRQVTSEVGAGEKGNDGLAPVTGLRQHETGDRLQKR